MSLKNNLACGAAISLALLATSPAFAQSQSQINAQMQALQQQIQQLQQQLQAVQTQVNTQQTQVQQVQQQQSAAAAKPTSTGITFGGNNGVKVTLGGFIEAASIYRSRDEFSDVGSSFSTIPFKQISTSHTSEFRESARQSRLSILAQGQYDNDTKFAAYYETDFLGNSTTSNSGESNSYVMRIRHLYMTVDKLDYGLHFLAGQSWSLVTPFKTGMEPRTEVIPLTIDAQYVPGFNWRRDPQVRLVADVNPMIHAGLSLESPQAACTASGSPPTGNGGGGNPTTTICGGTGNGSGGGTLNPSTTNYSMDIMPDVVAKVAVDPGFGHYELYGLGRAFQSRSVAVTGPIPPDNHIVFGGGVGGSAQMPVVPGTVDLQASTLIGKGIGQYGSSQLPDVTTDQFGNVHALNEFSVLAGLIGHVTQGLDVYTYAGMDRAQSEEFARKGSLYGYGASNLDNSQCDLDLEVTTATNCSAQNKDVWQITGGLWDKVWDGPGGSVRVGISYSFTRRDTFAGGTYAANGTTFLSPNNGAAPYATDNIIMTSFRYYPF